MSGAPALGGGLKGSWTLNAGGRDSGYTLPFGTSMPHIYATHLCHTSMPHIYATARWVVCLYGEFYLWRLGFAGGRRWHLWPVMRSWTDDPMDGTRHRQPLHLARAHASLHVWGPCICAQLVLDGFIFSFSFICGGADVPDHGGEGGECCVCFEAQVHPRMCARTTAQQAGIARM